MMSRSPTNTITNTNQVQETSPFRSPRSIAPSADPDGQTIQELRRTESVLHRQIQNELQEINATATVPQAINTEEDMVSVSQLRLVMTHFVVVVVVVVVVKVDQKCE